MLVPIDQLAEAYAEHGWTQDPDDPTSFSDERGWVSGHGHIDNLVDVRFVIQDIACWSPALAKGMAVWFISVLTTELQEELSNFPASYEISE